MADRIRWGALVCVATYLSALLVGPPGHHVWRELVLQVLAEAMIAVYVWRLVITERRSRTWRFWMACWVTFFTLGNAVSNAHTGPLPSDWANVTSLALFVWCYPCTLAGLFLRHRGHWRGRDLAAVLDALIGTLAIAAFFTSFVVPRALAEAGGHGVPLALVLAYPASDLTVLSIAVATTTLGRAETRRLSGWLILAIALLGAANWQYAIGVAAGTWRSGTPLDGIWMIGCAVIGLLACEHPDPQRKSARHDRIWALAGVAVPLLSALWAVLLLTIGTRVRIPVTGVALAATAATAVLLRLALAYAQVQSLAETSRMAHVDELTGLLNRRALMERLAEATSRLPEAPFAVVLTDLDGFKEVNDRLGHGAGDDLLRLVAGRLLDAVPAGGTLARLGGDEFAAILPDVATARASAEAMVASVAQHTAVAGQPVATALSVGLAVVDGAGPVTPGEALHRADVAMYLAKRAGGSRTHVFDEGDDQAPPPLVGGRRVPPRARDGDRHRDRAGSSS